MSQECRIRVVQAQHDDVGPRSRSSQRGNNRCHVGCDVGEPVSEDYGPRGNAFTGKVNWVQIDLGEDAEDADHLITPEERLRVAMARQ